MQLSQKKWKLAEQVPQEFIDKNPEFSELTLQLLYTRKLRTQDQIDEFFNPDYSQDLFDPMLLKDMDRALDRIELAVKKNERVAVFGDYDVDGVTSSVLLMELLRDVLGLKGQIYIPERVTEGYGMNKKAVQWLHEKKIDLIITCDCGVSNKEEIDYARKLGMDVIVTDHHHVSENYSKDYIIVDSKRKGDKYPFKELAGVGIVYKLIQALYQKKKHILKDTKDDFEKRCLDLVAIGTVADCSPIISENRTLVKYGLEVLRKTKRIGLDALMSAAKLEKQNVDTYSIGFGIAPRINAAGRLDHANSAFKLLASNTMDEAYSLGIKLNTSNQHRQKLTEEITKEAKKKIGEVDNTKKALFAKGEGWPLGIVGIVAGRITEEYGRPTFIMGESDGKCTGSARSNEAFNVIDAISKCKKFLLEYGGHKGAAGYSMKSKDYEKFTEIILAEANNNLTDDDLVPTLLIDKKIKLTEVSWNSYNEVLEFQPFGIANEKPLFLLEKIVVGDILDLGRDGKHKKIIVGDKNKIEALLFNRGKDLKNIKTGDIIDLVCEIDMNEWKGMKKLQLIIKDIKLNE